ncbi:MAG: hypothetical protein LC687_02110, partial [Actinobacteria bacterium]|nr:hypothetical protein [Actinomycetota bacterium]
NRDERKELENRGRIVNSEEVDELLSDAPEGVVNRLKQNILFGEGTAEEPYGARSDYVHDGLFDSLGDGSPEPSVTGQNARRLWNRSERSRDQRAARQEAWAGFIHDNPDKLDEMVDLVNTQRQKVDKAPMTAEQITPRLLEEWSSGADNHLENVHNLETNIDKLRAELEAAEAEKAKMANKTTVAKRFSEIVNGADGTASEAGAEQ